MISGFSGWSHQEECDLNDQYIPAGSRDVIVTITAMKRGGFHSSVDH